jgi:hypothetical protein
MVYYRLFLVSLLVQQRQEAYIGAELGAKAVTKELISSSMHENSVALYCSVLNEMYINYPSIEYFVGYKILFRD